MKEEPAKQPYTQQERDDHWMRFGRAILEDKKFNELKTEREERVAKRKRVVARYRDLKKHMLAGEIRFK